MTPSERPDRSDRLILAVVLLAAALLRLYRLGQANLWWDEALAIWAVRKGLVGVTVWTAGDVHPPLYFWCLWGWVRLFGESPFAMRSLSALIGTLTVWAVYGLGRQVGGRWCGLLGAALTAVAPFAVWWSQEMRMYALAGLLCTLSWRYLLCWLADARADAHASRRALILSALASLGALYTVFISAAAIAAQAVLVLCVWLGGGARRRLSMAVRWAAAQVAVLTLLAPWLVYSWGRMPTWSVSERVSPLFVARLYATLLVTGQSENIEQAMPAVIVALAVLVVGLCTLLLRPDRRLAEALGVGALVLAVIVPGVFVYISTLPRHLFYTPHVEARYFYPFAPAFWALLAWAVAALGRRVHWLASVLAAALLMLMSAYLPGYYRQRVLRDDLQSMVRTIVSQARADDMVLLDSGSRYPVFLYDYERLAPDAVRPAVATITREERVLDAAEVDRWLEAHLSADQRVWLAEVDVNLGDPERFTRAALNERLLQVGSWAYGANTLLLYAPDGQSASPENVSYMPEHALATDVAGGHLSGWDLPVTRYTPGSTAHLALQWARAPSEDIWLHVQTRSGLTLLLRRLPRGVGPVRQTQDLPLPVGLPSGEFSLALEDGVGHRVSLGAIRLLGERQPTFSAGQLSGATFGALRLESYALHVPPHVAAGDTITIDLAWRAIDMPAADYTVFVHILGNEFNATTNGPVWAQHDAAPLDGQWITSSWVPGDRLLDRHMLVIQENAPAGEYQVELGLYDSRTGERVNVVNVDGQPVGDRLLLPGFTLR